MFPPDPMQLVQQLMSPIGGMMGMGQSSGGAAPAAIMPTGDATGAGGGSITQPVARGLSDQQLIDYIASMGGY